MNRCAECGTKSAFVTRRDCVNSHFVCGDCWRQHIPQYTECPACDSLIEEGKGAAR